MISVVIPFYNAKKTLRNLLVPLLNQDFPKTDYEIILVDDGSADGSLETIEDLVKSSPVRMKISKLSENRGCFHARNQGILASEGDIIVFADSDVVPAKDWLRHLVHPFIDEGVGGVCGKIVTDQHEILILPIRVCPLGAVGLTPQGLKYGTCNVAYRKSILLSLGGFDENFDPRCRGDSDLAYRVLKAGFNIVYAPHVVVYHPVREIRSFSQLRDLAWQRHKDVLLYAKHGDICKSDFDVLLRPFISSLSPLPFLFFISMLLTIVSLQLYGLFSTLLLMGSLFLLWNAFFLVSGYAFFSNKKEVPLPIRLKASIFLLIYSLLLFLARVYGSLKYKRILI